MDLNKSLQNYYFTIQTDDFKSSIANTKPCPRLKPGSKSQKMILQRPFNFEKYESLMSSIENIENFYKPNCPGVSPKAQSFQSSQRLLLVDTSSKAKAR
jgi:hypothetical protein